jgi:anti-anti-sigma factor
LRSATGADYRVSGGGHPPAVDPRLCGREGCAVPPELPQTSELTTEIVREAGSIRLILRGELDMNGVLAAERAVQEAAALADRQLTIDLGELRFMDLFGARALLRVADQANTPPLRVTISNPRRHVRRLFELITDLARGRSLVGELVTPG